MSASRAVGNIIQKLLFTTSFSDITYSLEHAQKRLEDLEKKIDEKTRALQDQLGAHQAEGSSPAKR